VIDQNMPPLRDGLGVTDMSPTRYQAAKLYLIGKHAERLSVKAAELARTLAAPDCPPQRISECATELYTGDRGCLAVLFFIKELSGGVLPWAVVQGLNDAHAEIDQGSSRRSRKTMATDITRLLEAIAWLESAIVPDWDVRAKFPKSVLRH
jgi:hypothetical protein